MKSHELLRDAWERLHSEAQPGDVQANKWRKANLARRLGVHASQVTRWLSGERTPTLSQGTRLAMMLGVSPELYLSRRLAEEVGWVDADGEPLVAVLKLPPPA